MFSFFRAHNHESERMAIDNQNLSFLKKALKKDADVNAKDDEMGSAPLHIAASYQNLDAINFLVGKKGIDVNVKSEFKETPLHIAAMHYNQNPKGFFILFNHPQIDVNSTDIQRQTPLCCLVNSYTKNRTGISRLEEQAHLIFNDPRVNIKNQSMHHSLLGLATITDSIVIFKILIGRLRAENKKFELHGLGVTIPDPDACPIEFAAHSWLKKSPQITAYYAALSVLRKNKHLNCDQVFEMLAEQKFPRHEAWSAEHKKIAFYHAQYTLGLMPEHLFALVVFYCDGLLQFKKLKKDTGSSNQDAVALNQGMAGSEIDPVVASKARRFFRMAGQLPLELQMKLCNVAGDQSKELIPGKDSEPAFKALAAKCVP